MKDYEIGDKFQEWLADTFPGSCLESDLAKAFRAGWEAAEAS